MHRIKVLLQYMKGSRLRMIMSVIAVALSTYFMVQVPMLIRFSIDSVIGSEIPDTTNTLVSVIHDVFDLEFLRSNLWIIGIIIVLSTALRGLFLFLKGHYSASASERIALGLREKLYKHILDLSYEYHVQAETGDLVQRCTSDVDTIRRFLGTQFVEIGSVIFLLTITIGSMLKMHVGMTLGSTFILPLGAWMSVVFFRRINDVFKEVDEQEGKLTTLIQENLTGVRVVRAFGRQSHETSKFDKENDTYSDKIYDLIKEFARFWSTQDVIVLAQIAVMVVIGTYFTVAGQMTLGTFVAFTTMAGYLLWPVRTLGRILSEMSKSFVSIDRIEHILMVKSEYDHQGVRPDLNGDIVFHEVDFAYETSERPILKKINLTIKEGETLAILGPTGAGKSTLVHLLTRFYDVKTGTITMNGVDISGVDKHHVRKHVALVLQEPFLFAKSIEDNIRIAKGEANQDEVILAAQTAHIHDNIMGFDKGYDTMVGEKGVSLSGGQKQRVAIARKLITDAPVLVFDDSLSAVDTETDAAIRKRIEEKHNGLTTIIISHRIASIYEADHIIVLEDGVISQEGKHEDLVTQTGLYKRIWEIQDADVLKRIS